MHWKPGTAWFSKLLCFQLPGVSFLLVSCWFLPKIRSLMKSSHQQRALAIVWLHPRPPFLLFFFSPVLQQKQLTVLILGTAMFRFVYVPEKPQHSPVKICRTNPSSGGCRNKSRGACTQQKTQLLNNLTGDMSPISLSLYSLLAFQILSTSNQEEEPCPLVVGKSWKGITVTSLLEKESPGSAAASTRRCLVQSRSSAELLPSRSNSEFYKK